MTPPRLRQDGESQRWWPAFAVTSRGLCPPLSALCACCRRCQHARAFLSSSPSLEVVKTQPTVALPLKSVMAAGGQGLPRVKLPSMVVGHCPTSIPRARSWWPQGLATVTLPEEMASLCLRCECKEETLPQTGMGQQVSALAWSHRPALRWVLAFARAPSCSGELYQTWPR